MAFVMPKAGLLHFFIRCFTGSDRYCLWKSDYDRHGPVERVIDEKYT